MVFLHPCVMLIRFSLTWCFVPFGIVQAVHCGARYAAACSLANSVQPLLTLIIVEPTHPHPGCGQSFAWVFASLVQVLWMSAAATGLVPHPTLWCGTQAMFFDRFFLAGDIYQLRN